MKRIEPLDTYWELRWLYKARFSGVTTLLGAIYHRDRKHPLLRDLDAVMQQMEAWLDTYKEVSEEAVQVGERLYPYMQKVMSAAAKEVYGNRQQQRVIWEEEIAYDMTITTAYLHGDIDEDEYRSRK